MTAKKCTKTRDARAKLLFCQSKPIAFLPCALTSPSLLLKLPIDTRGGGGTKRQTYFKIIHFKCLGPDEGRKNSPSPSLRISVRCKDGLNDEYAASEDRLCISTVRLKNDDFKVP